MALRIALEDLTEGGTSEQFGTGSEGRRLEVIDLVIRIRLVLARGAGNLALLLCGRRLPSDRFGVRSPLIQPGQDALETRIAVHTFKGVQGMLR